MVGDFFWIDHPGLARADTYCLASVLQRPMKFSQVPWLRVDHHLPLIVNGQEPKSITSGTVITSFYQSRK